MTSQGTLSDFGSAFSASGFNNGRQRYGNTMTHFSDDGRLVTNPDDISYPHQRPERRPERHQERRLPDVPDYRSYDAGRERRRYERRQDDTWKDREIAREREREFRPRDFYSPPSDNHASHYPSRHYGGGGGAPVYGRTLPLPMSREPGPPVRRFDDYRTREMRPNYEKSQHYDRNINRNPPGTYDWRIPVPGNNYDQTGLVASRNYGGKYGVLATTKRTKFSQRPVAWYFIFAGLMLLLAGLVNLTLCVPNYYYCFIWLSVLTLILGGVGIYHGGRFKEACRNLYYVGHAVVVTLAAMVSSGLVFYQYFPLVKEIAAEKNQTALYVKYAARTPQPLVTTVPTSNRVWVCLAFDSVGMVFVVADYIALYALILVAHRYWNYKKRLGKLVVPFCRPMLFNPFMEMVWGELLVLVGMVSVFGCYNTEWHTYYTAVAAGAFVIITGGVSSAAAKVPNRTWVAGLAIFFNFIGIVACVVTIVLNCLGIYDNIKALQAGIVTKKDYLVASALIFAFVLAAALICFFYCLGLLVRFSYYLTRSGYDRDAFTTSSRSDQTVSTVPHRYGYDKDRGFDANSDPPLPYRSPRQGFFGRRY